MAETAAAESNTGERARLRLSEQRRNQRRAIWQRPGVIATLFLLPNIVGFLVFHMGPVFYSFWLSLNEWELLLPPKFVGLANFATLFFDDEIFWKSLGNTFYYSLLVIPANLTVSLTLALAINRPLRGIKIFRTLYFLPVVTSMVAVAMAFKWLYSYDWGLINFLLELIHLPPVRWLGNSKLALPAVALVAIWKNAGYNMIIFLAGLQGVPATLYEAADIDGANTWHKFWRITLPLLTPTIFFVTIMSVISSFQVFDSVYLLTQGGPGYATTVYNYYLYLNAFRFLRFGMASALAYILFAILLGLTLFQWRLFGSRVQYELI
jgi:multiple sugar transport system permease protein